jgi:hypothetical protein
VGRQIKKGGGISFNATLKLTHLSDRLVQSILHAYSTVPRDPCRTCRRTHAQTNALSEIFNAEVVIREDATAGPCVGGLARYSGVQ